MPLKGASSKKKKPQDVGPEDDDKKAKKPDDEDGTSSSSDDEEDDDLILEGVMVRNPDVSDSDDTTSSEESEEEDEDKDEKEEDASSSKPPPAKKAKKTNDLEAQDAKQQAKKKKRSKKKKEAGPDIIQVEFIFCDMDEKYFHGIKSLLTASCAALYGPHTSALADLMIENVNVGTVASTEGDTDGNVFGFASVLNVTASQSQPSIQALKKICLDKCPAAHKKELQVVLSGKTNRPAGFYLHGRMVNMPLEIVQILHEQLVLDMDWAVENAEGGEQVRKSLDFGAFVLFAPTYRASGVSYFKMFDDEIFASHAEFTFELALPKPAGAEETPYCTVVVMTKTGHRAAMQSIAEMVGTGGGESAR